MKRLRLFISHPWAYSNDYRELKLLLSSALASSEWQDLSIPSDTAIKIAGERLNTNWAQAEALGRETAELQRLLSESLSAAAEVKSYQNLEALTERAQEEILEDHYVETVRRLERLKHRYEGRDVAEELVELEKRSDSLREQLGRCEYEMKRLRGQRNVIKVPLLDPDVIRNATGEQRALVIERYPELAAAIRARVAVATAVLIAVYPFSPYRPWLEFEYLEAAALGKPIVGVIRTDRSAELPKELVKVALPVAWSEKDLRDVLFTLV